MKQSEHEIVNNARKFLAEGMISMFIGYENGTLPLRTSPCFVQKPSDAGRLVWNPFCAANLTVYLKRSFESNGNDPAFKIGVLCKGCDSRSIVELIKEQQIKRDRLFIIGISCSGIVDQNKIAKKVPGHEVVGSEEHEGNIVIRTAQREYTLDKSEVLCDACTTCTNPTPTEYDILIKTEHRLPVIDQTESSVQRFARLSRKERWQMFERELSRCIRCNACRRACPNCYCKECFADQTNPRWLSTANELSEILFYHIVRIFHQAGRCVDCGACVRACPMDIDLRPFSRMLINEVHTRFDYDAGVSLNEAFPLAVFAANDQQEFMIEPE
ncbi:4Fe-4S dicluster domain-containing protein [candidate division WOR-3 bacterium]|nr:4Fe-4S dicluster domain-containing protein [candidate division WOR-3 bacterium]